MPDFIADMDLPGYRGEDARRARAWIIEEGRTTYAGGVMRWASNGSVPPPEYLALAAALGKPVHIEASEEARRQEIRALAASIRKREAAMTQEERAERAAMARAAHGPGVTLVNVLTGTRFRT